MADGHNTLGVRRVLLAAVCLLSIAAVWAPVRAQPASKIPKIGFLTQTTRDGVATLVDAFRQGMRELGYVEGKTFVLDTRFAEGHSERLPELARELVGRKVDVIVATSDGPIAAAKRETRTIPIVMTNGADPVGTGFVASLAHPGGNVTGLSNVSADLSGKRLELLREVVPGLTRVAFLWNPDARGTVLDYKESQAAAISLHLELQSVEVSSAADLDHAFSTVTSQRPQAVIVPPGNPVMFSKRAEIASFAQKTRLPSMYGLKEYVDAGGLMSYGPSLPAMYRRAATYVDKILKGTAPGDLPVERPTKFELVINLKTAKALGLTMPRPLLERADQLIQ
jgi:putative tryptophan/tyrosine transport system substrate-binding protein